MNRQLDYEISILFWKRPYHLRERLEPLGFTKIKTFESIAEARFKVDNFGCATDENISVDYHAGRYGDEKWKGLDPKYVVSKLSVVTQKPNDKKSRKKQLDVVRKLSDEFCEASIAIYDDEKNVFILPDAA